MRLFGVAFVFGVIGYGDAAAVPAGVVVGGADERLVPLALRLRDPSPPLLPSVWSRVSVISPCTLFQASG